VKKILLAILAAVTLGVVGCSNETTTQPAGQNVPQTLSRITVQLDARPNISDGKVSFTGTTNLPDGTELLVTLGGRPGYMAQMTTTVSGGKFNTATFSDNAGPIRAGEYNVEVLMPIAGVQPKDVQRIIGEDASNLEGELVKEGTMGRTVEFDTTIVIK
jgi:hypothetical protein